MGSILEIAAVVGFLGLLPLGLWDLYRRRRRAERAVDQLRRRDFHVERAIMSEDQRALLALDDRDRAAACELGRQGDVLVARIARRGTFDVDATEDGEPFEISHRRTPGVKGRLVFALTFERKRVEFRFLDRVPGESEGGKDWDDYKKARKMFAWWCRTLRGDPPVVSYKTPRALWHRVIGSAVEQEVAETLGPDLPEARVVERDRET